MARAFAGQGPLVIPFSTGPGGAMDLLLWFAPLQGALLLPAAWLGGVVVGRLISIAVSSVTILPLVAITRQRYGEGAALWAGLLYALAPEAACFGTYLWSENLAVLLAVTAIWLTYRQRPFLSGACWGLTALTRMSSVAWLPVAVVWAYLHFGRSLRPALLWVLPCLLLVAGYSAWNSHRAGYRVFITDTNGYNLYDGNNRWGEPDSAAGMDPTSERLRSGLAAVAKSHRAYMSLACSLGWQYVTAHPGQFLARGFKKLAWAWGPYTFPAMRVDLGQYSHLRALLPRAAAKWVLEGSRLLLLALILLGGTRSWRTDYTRLVVALMVVTSLGCFVLVGRSRYTYPLVVLALPVAAAAIAKKRTAAPQEQREHHAPGYMK
jgi:hypothetical protein